MYERTIITVFFVGLMSVYTGQAMSANQARRANEPAQAKPGGTEVRLLDETTGPLVAAPPANPAAPASSTRPAEPGKVAVSESGTVEIHVSETSLSEVLRMLSIQARRNIIASKEVRGTVTADLYGVTIREALDAILKANGCGYREKGNFIYVYTAKELAEIEKSERQAVTEVFRLHYTPAQHVLTVIKPALSNEAQVSVTPPAASGIEAGAKDLGGNSLATEDIIVVRDYPENIERVRKIIRELDRRPQQILVEATIVAARLTEDNALGIDFTLVGGVDFSGVTAAGATVGQMLSGAAINNSTLTEKGVVAGNTGFTSALPQKGLRIGVLTNNISIFLQALEEITDTTVLANPKVLTLNKQKGEVLVGREDGYLTTTTTETASVQSVEFLKTGTRLIFRPYIGNDGYIRMEVHPEDSDGKVVNGLPSKTTTEVTTNIMVKDGHTIIIGGLFREGSVRSRSQVPGLGNVPVVGALFRNQHDATIREEIIILLTPHIVKDDNAFAAASERELREMEKLRAGVRKGMMPWGRERLAECFYNAALEEMARPNANRQVAIFHLDCATNLNPKFLEAIRMKENLTGREISAVDNSSIRSFVKRQILAERAAAPASPGASAAPPAVRVAVQSPPAAPPAIAPAAVVSEKPAAPPQQPNTPPQTPSSNVERQSAVEPPSESPAAPVRGTGIRGMQRGLAAMSKPLVPSAPTTRPAAPAQSDPEITVTELPVEAVEGTDD